MVVDPIENVSEICLRVEAVEFGGLDDGHGAGKCFCARVGAGEQPILPADPDRAQSTLGWIIVDAHPAVLEEQAEGGPAAQAIAERLGQIALARNAGQLLLGPDAEGLDLRLAVLLADGEADIGRPASDLTLDVVEGADPV